MKTTVQAVAAAAITLIASSAAHAQEAVQWRVQDGGNGHWYGLRLEQTVTFWQAATEALEVGAHLVTISSHQENNFVRQFSAGRLVHLGGYQDTGAAGWSEPAGGWRWVNGEPWTWTGWCAGQPDNASWGGFQGQGIARYIGPDSSCWDDAHSAEQIASWPIGDTVIEWSADCNNDGIVDYGQCRDGTLADYNGNNVPDCCESGTSCVAGNYPVQWRTEDGGNGHWYTHAPTTTGIAAESIAVSLHGSLVSISSPPENAFVRKLLAVSGRDFAMLGLIQADDQPTTDAGWGWTTGEPLIYSNWTDFDGAYGFSAPDDNPCACCGVAENNQCNQGLMYLDGRWDDIERGGSCAGFASSSIAVIEWSADCNNDGVVDKGQILQGQLVDADSNGVPNICEDPCPGDITNGGTVDAADLSILLAAWGTNGQAEFDTDIDGSGLVDGGDLALVLGGWGPCPQ